MVQTALRPLLVSLAVGFALPVGAQGIGDMTDSERETFRAEVRDYLLENPEVLMEAISVLEERQAQSQSQDDAALIAGNAEAIFEDGYSYVGGNPEGDVTVVEFMDYRCGYCRRAYPEVAELIESDGNIRYIVKEFPILGEQSLMASRFAFAVMREAGDAAYAETHAALMTLRGEVTEDSLRALAEDQGLDADAIFVAMDAPEIDAQIARNRQLGQTLGISGTPSFVFGDQMVRGYVPLEAMREMVSEERG